MKKSGVMWKADFIPINCVIVKYHSEVHPFHYNFFYNISGCMLSADPFSSDDQHDICNSNSNSNNGINSPTTRLCVQQLIQTTNKEYLTPSHYWPFTRVDSQHKGPVMRKVALPWRHNTTSIATYHKGATVCCRFAHLKAPAYFHGAGGQGRDPWKCWRLMCGYWSELNSFRFLLIRWPQGLFY